MTTDVTPTSPDPHLSEPQQFVARALNELLPGRPLYPDPTGFWVTARDIRTALTEGRVSPEFILWELLKARLIYPPLYGQVLDWMTGEAMHAAHRIAQTACGPACSRCGHDTASHYGGYGSCRRCSSSDCGGYVLRGAS